MASMFSFVWEQLEADTAIAYLKNIPEENLECSTWTSILFEISKSQKEKFSRSSREMEVKFHIKDISIR